ncbi:MAG: hypothetical protein H7Y86_17195 [Rhizobacter sp.]|nr:hypothetical protein [Ferruginibacter sp.]
MFSIEGNWVGQLTYDESYPPEYRNEILYFTMKLWREDGILRGTCEDDITKELSLNPATLEGTYDNDVIYFIKHYPCLIIVDEENNVKADMSKPSVAIQYLGQLRKKVFSSKYYLKGAWDISGSYLNESGRAEYYTMGGNWTMQKI